MAIWRLGLVCAMTVAFQMAPNRPATRIALAQGKQPMKLIDVLNIPRIDEAQITRDGKRIVFQMRTTDWPGKSRVPQVWQINGDGTGLRRVTSSEAGAALPRFSPDGSTIAFVSQGQIFISPSDGGAARQISKHATAVSDIGWHPDGKSIYFLALEPLTDAQRQRQRLRGDVRVLDEYRHRHLWKIGVAEGKETRITEGDFTVSAFKVAPDGRRIVVSERPTPLPVDTDKLELWTIAADGSAPVQLTKNSVPEDDGEMSPDGSQVLFIARANRRMEPYYNANLFAVPAGGGTARAIVPEFPYEVLRASWALDGKSIWAIVNMGVHIEVFQFDVATRAPKQITHGDHAVVPVGWQVAGDRLVFMIDEPARIGDIWTLTPGSTTPKRVTNVYSYLDRDFALPRQERVEWKGADGVAIEGVLTYPIDYQPGTRYPLVVQLHGGPESSDRFGWGSIFFYYQPVWAARGWAILRPNYRGSSGYGNAFYREPIGGYFKNSHLDVLAGVDKVVAMGIADPNQLAMMGWSAGGHLVNKLITFTTRFKAASSGAGVADWISLYGQSDTHSERDLWFGGTLWQKNAPIQTYWEHSPLKYVTAARTPTIFFIGDSDPRVPMGQAMEMSRALNGQRVPSEVHIAPGEGHDWVQPAHQLYKMNTEIEWIEKHTRNLSYTSEPPPTANDSHVVPVR